MQDTTIVGNVTDDPELKFTPSGAAVANFTVAVNHRRFNRQTNEWEDAGTDWYRCAAWRDLAENVVETITKGQRVVVTGGTRQNQFTRQDGSKGMAVELAVEDIGPSLRFATAKVARVERGGGQQRPQQGNGGQQGNAWGGGAQQPQQGNGGNPWGGPPGGQAQQQWGGGHEEPPF